MFDKSTKNLSLLHGLMRYPLYICLSLICLSLVLSCTHVHSKENAKAEHRTERLPSKEERISKTPSHMLANRLGNMLFGKKEKDEKAEKGGITKFSGKKKKWTLLSKEPLDDAKLIKLQEKKAKNVFVSCRCRVYELVLDDTKGRKHQRFLLALSNKTRVLVAHNLNLAPRVPVEPGDVVEVKGEYIWNEKGGVIHLTHHATGIRHKAGSITLRGKTYN